jgi:hypothetical protein
MQDSNAGALSLCANAHQWPDFERLVLPDAADLLKARWLIEAVSIQWPGGRFSQPAGASTSRPCSHRRCRVRRCRQAGSCC